MAIVRKMEPIELERDSSHSEADAYTVIASSSGEKLLQIVKQDAIARVISIFLLGYIPILFAIWDSETAS